MNLIFTNSGKRTTPEEIRVFESKYNMKLPFEYINFLLENNGGKPNNVYYIENDSDLVINFFLSIGNSKYNIEEYYIDMVIEQKLLPIGILPIGEDAFGNVICISCREEDFGIVYFWDHEDDNVLIELSKNFNFLLQNLVSEI